MGAANVLGAVAAGYTDAARLDQQRQYEQEKAKREQFSQMFTRLAQDETAHPETRNAAMRLALEGAHLPWNKIWKPDFNQLIAPAQPPQSFTPPSPPSTQGTPATLTGAIPTPVPPPSGAAGPPELGPPQLQFAPQAPPSMATNGPSVELAGSGHPAGLFQTPEELGQHAAAQQAPVLAGQVQASGATSRAQIEAQLGARDVYLEHLKKQGLTDQQAIEQASLAFGHPIPYGMFRAGKTVQMTAAQARADQELSELVDPNLPDGATVVAQYGTMGQPMRVTQNLVPSLTQKTSTSTQSIAPSGAITTTSTKGPVLPSAGARAPSPPPSTSSGKPAVAAKPPKSTAHITPASLDLSAVKDAPGLAAIDWATKGIVPKGGTMAERQVRTRMKELGLEPALPVPAGLQRQIQQSFVARGSAIGLIDDVLKNQKVLDSLLSAGKIQIAIDPGTGHQLLSRVSGLTDQEAQVAGDFQQLIEHANLLRGPLGATGFRGEEAWQALQAQRGNLLADPRITRQVLAGMRERLVGLNSADKMVITGQGMNAPNAPPQTGTIDVVAPNGTTYHFNDQAAADAFKAAAGIP